MDYRYGGLCGRRSLLAQQRDLMAPGRAPTEDAGTGWLRLADQSQHQSAVRRCRRRAEWRAHAVVRGVRTRVVDEND